MRNRVFLADLERLIAVIGRRCTGYGSVFFVGGTSAAYMGWRQSTMDVDLALNPEPAGLFSAMESIKNELNISIELASPADFVPVLPGWQSRSVYITHAGRVDFYHFDFFSQALAKLDRAEPRDLEDVAAMLRLRLIEAGVFFELFEKIKDVLPKYRCSDAQTILQRARKILV